MNIKEKNIIWLDSFDFMTHKKKEKLLELSDINKPFLQLKELKNKLLFLISEKEFETLISNANQEYLNILFYDFKKLDIIPVTFFSDHYSQSLKNIDSPPFVLYCKGNIELLSSDCFAIVGSRHITNYGKLATEKFTKDLLKANFTIVSGLASGVDTVAHTITLSNGGKTIAVLAGGLDEIYPSTNTGLAKQILAQNGLIISEVRPFKKTESYMFPIRNRIIAGLSRGVLITEAQEKSGVIHTKNYALEYGKDVFAVPGSIFSLLSAGTNLMITNGQAKAVTKADEILQEYNIDLTKTKTKSYNLSFEESIIINLLSSQERSFQELFDETKFEIRTLNTLLTTLSIRGIIKKLAGNMYYMNT